VGSREDRGDADWERIARRDPYWAVLTNSRFRAASMSQADRDDFFRRGERHIVAVFASCETRRAAPWSPQRALDFGCGVGRLLPALARRCAAVVGVDVSPSMLEEARANCRRLAISNVELTRATGDPGELDGGFDLIHSVIVFQHIAPERGERILATLCDKLASGGLAVLHFTTRSRENDLQRKLTRARADIRPFNAVANLLSGRHASEPPMRMYAYDPQRLRRIIADRGCTLLETHPFAVPGYDGELLYLEKKA
jgi:SAM-dependent methyltransferase